MIDPLDDATQTILDIEVACLVGREKGGSSELIADILDIIDAWKQRPEEEEEAA